MQSVKLSAGRHKRGERLRARTSVSAGSQVNDSRLIKGSSGHVDNERKRQGRRGQRPPRTRACAGGIVAAKCRGHCHSKC